MYNKDYIYTIMEILEYRRYVVNIDDEIWEKVILELPINVAREYNCFSSDGCRCHCPRLTNHPLVNSGDAFSKSSDSCSYTSSSTGPSSGPSIASRQFGPIAVI